MIFFILILEKKFVNSNYILLIKFNSTLTKNENNFVATNKF